MKNGITLLVSLSRPAHVTECFGDFTNKGNFFALILRLLPFGLHFSISVQTKNNLVSAIDQIQNTKQLAAATYRADVCH